MRRIPAAAPPRRPPTNGNNGPAKKGAKGDRVGLRKYTTAPRGNTSLGDRRIDPRSYRDGGRGAGNAGNPEACAAYSPTRRRRAACSPTHVCFDVVGQDDGSSHRGSYTRRADEGTSIAERFVALRAGVAVKEAARAASRAACCQIAPRQ